MHYKHYTSAVLTGIVLLFVVLSFTARCDAAGPTEKSVYSSHVNAQNKIALTFDDGPHPRYTPEILDILREFNIHATFFLIGENAERYPELVERIQREGHEIGNHTYGHANLQTVEECLIQKEIERAENSILLIADQRPKLLRPPGGLYDERVCRAALDLEYDIILWNIDTLDWAHTPSKAIVDNVLTNVQCGDIILCHDFIGGDPSPTPEALRILIPDLLARNFDFATVSELIHCN